MSNLRKSGGSEPSAVSAEAVRPSRAEAEAETPPEGESEPRAAVGVPPGDTEGDPDALREALLVALGL